MNDIDVELQLYSSDPILVGQVPIFPLTIHEIARIGYSKYNSEIRLLCLSKEDIKVLIKAEALDMEVFDFWVLTSMTDIETRKVWEFWLSKLTHSKVVFSQKEGVFVGEGFKVSRDNYPDIQRVIRLRNAIFDELQDEENPANDKARELLQKRAESRAKRKALRKKSDSESLTLADLVSILASGMGLTLDAVMRYDIYQFNDQFNRLKIMDDYEINVQVLLHGGKREDVDLRHWITKIEHNAGE